MVLFCDWLFSVKRGRVDTLTGNQELLMPPALLLLPFPEKKKRRKKKKGKPLNFQFNACHRRGILENESCK